MFSVSLLQRTSRETTLPVWTISASFIVCSCAATGPGNGDPREGAEQPGQLDVGPLPNPPYDLATLPTAPPAPEGRCGVAQCVHEPGGRLKHPAPPPFEKCEAELSPRDGGTPMFSGQYTGQMRNASGGPKCCYEWSDVCRPPG